MAELQTFDLIQFGAGTFAAALVTGVAGFAFGIAAAAVWLHFLSPAHATALIVAYGSIVQGISVWLTAIWLGGTGLVDAETLRLFLIGLPLLLAGTWAGLRLYARLDEAGFRKVVLGLLLISGRGLVVHGS